MEKYEFVTDVAEGHNRCLFDVHVRVVAVLHQSVNELVPAIVWQLNGENVRDDLASIGPDREIRRNQLS